MDMPMDDEMMGDEMMPEQESGAGFSVELYVGADGSMSVNVESGEEEAQQHGGEMPTGTPVASLEEAITKIIEIVKNGGQMPDTAGEQAEFDAGYEPEAMNGAQKRFG